MVYVIALASGPVHDAQKKKIKLIYRLQPAKVEGRTERRRGPVISVPSRLEGGRGLGESQARD